MAELKRKIAETDPDYEDVPDQQAKRQRVLEQDAREAACKKITTIIKREFHREICDKEKELQLIDLRLNQCRLVMDRLRACVVASYYGRANRTLSSMPATNCSSSRAAPATIHPAVKQFLGKAPRAVSNQGSSSHAQDSTGTHVPHTETTCVRATPRVLEPSPRVSASATPRAPVPVHPSRSLPPPSKGATVYDDRRARFKVKKKIVVGNVSRYIPVDQREATDMSSHKWMVYVRGHKSDPDISSFVNKVWFFLHHSYKPNDHVEISMPPFHLTRRGWGEFPVRVQLHFVDSRNKKVDIIHHLKLDKTFTGLQKLGAETVVEVELERDFFDQDDDSDSGEPHQPSLTNGPAVPVTATHHNAMSCLTSSSIHSPSPRTDSPTNRSTKVSTGMSTGLSSSLTSSPPSSSSSSSSVTDTSLVSAQVASSSLKSSTSSPLCSSQQRETTPCGNNVLSCSSKQGETTPCGNNVLSCSSQQGETTPCGNNILSCSSLQGETTPCGNNLLPCLSQQGETTPCGNNVLCVLAEGSSGMVEKGREGEGGVVVDSLDGTTALTDCSCRTGFVDKMNDTGGRGSGGGDEFNVTIQHDESETHDSGSGNGSSGIGGSGHCDNVEKYDEVEVSVVEEVLDRAGKRSKVDVVEALTRIRGRTARKLSQGEEGRKSSLSLVEASINGHGPSPKGSVTPSCVSLLTSSTLDQMKHQHLLKQQQSPPVRSISILKPQGLGHVSSSGQQPINNVHKKYTVITKPRQAATSLTGTPILSKAVSIQDGQKATPTLSKAVSIQNGQKATPTLSKAVCIQDGQKATPTNPSLKPVLTQPHAFSLQQPQHKPVMKTVSLLSANQSQAAICQPTPKRLIYLKPSLSTGAAATTTSLSTSTASPDPGSISIPRSISSVSSTTPPATIKNRKQISLLTGLVITAPKQQQQHQQDHHNTNSSNSHSPCHYPILTSDPMPKPSPSNLTAPFQHTDLGHLMVTKTADQLPGRAVSPMLPPPSQRPSTYSLLTPHPSPLRLSRDSSTSQLNQSTSHSMLAHTSSPNVVIAYPNGHNTLHTTPDYLTSDYLTSDIAGEVKMSAIGKTKHRLIQHALPHTDPEQERIWRQYQVLNNYKNLHKDQAEVRKFKDTIDGEVEVIPKIDPEDYPDMYSLMKAAIRLHPIVQVTVNKLTHPYCAESRDQWQAWPLGKRRASEWHRSCFTLKYIKDCLQGATTFRGVKVMTTKQLVNWCRLHAFSPQTIVLPPPDLNPTLTCDPSDPSNVSPTQATAQSYTYLTAITPRLSDLGKGRSPRGDGPDVEVVLEDCVPSNTEEKEEVVEADDLPIPELLPLTDGAVFVHDWMRKRGVKLLSQEDPRQGMAGDVLYQVMTEFGSDILRKAFSVYSQRHKSRDEMLTVGDIHAALCTLPAAAFCRNAYLGKEEEEEEDSTCR